MRMSSRLLIAFMALAAVSCTHSTMRDHDGQSGAGPKPSPPAAGVDPIGRRGGFVTASDGVRIYYEVCGAGPAMVFVHGLGGNHAVWFHQVAHFATDHTVITLSQRGFAPSGGDPNHYDVHLLTRDLEAVMHATGVEHAVVIGQSMGGWTALDTALENPSRVDALILADTLAGIDDNEITAQRREIAASAARLRSAPPPLGVHPALSAKFSAEHPELGYLYQTLNTFGAPSPEAIVRQLFAVKVGGDRLKAVRVPVLFIVGSEDKLFPPPLVRKAATYIAGAEVSEIAGAGHSPYFEQPAAWNRAVESFLARNRSAGAAR